MLCHAKVSFTQGKNRARMDDPITGVEWIALAWAWADSDTGVSWHRRLFVGAKGSVQKEKLNALPTE